MKKSITLILSLLFIHTLFAQTPQSFRYQAVARDNSGNLLANQDVSFRISILIGAVSGTTAYTETHTGLSTNAFGLAEFEIGKGTPVTGTFSAIDWGNNSYYVKIEMDPSGGTTYQVLSTSQLLSVPYALHAKTVETGDKWGDQTVQTDATLWGNGTSGNSLMVADNGITSVKIANGNILTDDLGYGSVNNAKIQDGTITTADMANDIIISSKIVDGTVGNADLADNAVTTLKIADGAVGTADLAISAVTTEKLGNVSVSTEKIQNSVVTAEKLAANAVTETKIATGAVSGAKIAQAGATAGQTLKWSGTAWVPADDELTLPYSGSVTQSTGFALEITSSASSCIKGTGVVGIIGETNTAAGGNFGMGVSGNAHQTSGNFSGVQGTTNSTTGVGVYGLAYQSSGVTKGVYGESRSPDGYAVHGINYSTTGQAIGVYGDTYSGTGIGVYGGTASTGNGKAIYGISNSTGYAGYFLGGQVYIDTKLGIGKGAVYTLDVVGTANLLNGISSGIALRCNGDEAIWYNGTYYSWGYGADYNFFADRIKIGGNGNEVPSSSYALYVTGTAYATGIWSSSDLRFKKNISAIGNPLERMLKVRGTSFEFRREEFPEYSFAKGRQMGFIAQELEEVFPELVNTESDGFKSVNYNGMIPVLLEAMKEQQKLIDRLKNENSDLKAENLELKANDILVNSRLERLEQLTGVAAENKK